MERERERDMKTQRGEWVEDMKTKSKRQRQGRERERERGKRNGKSDREKQWKREGPQRSHDLVTSLEGEQGLEKALSQRSHTAHKTLIHG